MKDVPIYLNQPVIIIYFIENHPFNEAQCCRTREETACICELLMMHILFTTAM